MRAGRLDRFITIQTKGATQSASGMPLDAWSNLDGVLRRPASMAPVKGDEKLGDPQTRAEQQTEFRVRYSQIVAALSPLQRVIYPALSDEEAADDDFVVASSRIFDIQDVSEIGRREGLLILTLRKTDVSP